jgi:hypothetical protein
MGWLATRRVNMISEKIFLGIDLEMHVTWKNN